MGLVAVLADGASLTYAELDARANRLARHLRSLGVVPEARVGLCTERSLDMVVGMLGILKAGGGFVPIDPRSPDERLAWLLEDSACEVLVTQRRHLERVSGLGRDHILCLEDLELGKDR